MKTMTLTCRLVLRLMLIGSIGLAGLAGLTGCQSLIQLGASPIPVTAYTDDQQPSFKTQKN